MLLSIFVLNDIKKRYMYLVYELNLLVKKQRISMYHLYIHKNMETITKSFQTNKQNNGQLILSLYLFSSDNVETKQANKIYEYFTKLFNDLRMQTENHASYDETTEQKRCQAAVHLHLPSIQCRLLCGHVHALIARQALTSEQAVKQSRFQLDSCKFDLYPKCRLLSCCNETHLKKHYLI